MNKDVDFGQGWLECGHTEAKLVAKNQPEIFEMSDTIRRKNVEINFPKAYLVPGGMKNKSTVEIDKIADALFHSDRVDGDSAPKWIRKDTNRSERYRVKSDIRRALDTDSLDNFIDSRLYMPYYC